MIWKQNNNAEEFPGDETYNQNLFLKKNTIVIAYGYKSSDNSLSWVTFQNYLICDIDLKARSSSSLYTSHGGLSGM